MALIPCKPETSTDHTCLQMIAPRRAGAYASQDTIDDLAVVGSWLLMCGHAPNSSFS